MTPDNEIPDEVEYADIIVSMWALGDRLDRMKETLEDINAQIERMNEQGYPNP